MLTFIKLGGSLITDKRVEASFRTGEVERLAGEIAEAIATRPGMSLLIGHGSGSFGHFAAKRHNTIAGVQTDEQWRGFAEVATIAAELNYLVARVFHLAGLPVWRIQPSASSRSHNAQIVEMALDPIKTALAHGLVPLVYGDVGLDTIRGGTITSTEAILTYLAQHLPVNRILLLGDVEGVYDADGTVISEITLANVQQYESVLGASAGTDVTGGMLTKVQDMVSLVQQIPGLEIRIMDGKQPGLLRRTLLGETHPGTHIHQG